MSAEKSSSKSSKPLYFGGVAPASQSTGRSSPMYYGGKSPMYYSGGHAYYSGSAGGPNSEGDSLVGTITIGRMIRVVSQRWLTVMVFLVVGLVAAFAVYRISPTIYEASSVFEMSMRRPSIMKNSLDLNAFDQGSSFNEVFNTRLAQLSGRELLKQILAQYRTTYPSSTATDEEILSTLSSANIELKRMSRLISITIRSEDPEFAANLANAYAKAIESFTSEQNRINSDTAVSLITQQTETQRRTMERADKAVLDFRMANKIDFMESQRETLKQTLGDATVKMLDLQTQLNIADDMVRTLEVIQNDPENFGTLPSSVPRSSEIATAYQVLQDAIMAKNSLLARYTANHPDVRVKEKEAEVYKQQFADVVVRALNTGRGNVQSLKNQLAQQTSKHDTALHELAAVEQNIVGAEQNLKMLERESEVAMIEYKNLLQRGNEARLVADESSAMVRIVTPATIPSSPVLPNPMIIFSAGVILGLGAGLLFVLVVDHLEDTIVSLSDIEQRLGLKVLAVLPHVRRKKRSEVARLVSEDKFSQFAEAIAGLRNLLDSPRYQGIANVLLCMSTMPGEGKTISSSSLCVSDAMAGKRTLLVDFDIRRPRVAGVWKLNMTRENSLAHVLSKNDPSLFDTLPQASGVENMDVIGSLASMEVNPSSLMGSQIIPAFFTWARAHYDRIVIDSPPFGIVGDVMTLASMVDGIMIMCCPDRTRFKPIKHATRHLTEAGATILGVIVNDVDMTANMGMGFLQYGSASRYAYQYSYGAYGSKSRSKAPDASAEPADATVTVKDGPVPISVVENEDDVAADSVDEGATDDE